MSEKEALACLGLGYEGVTGTGGDENVETRRADWTRQLELLKSNDLVPQGFSIDFDADKVNESANASASFKSAINYSTDA